jgi:predicted  nucleic acid-binding Zn-ribbon protein
MVYYYSFAVVLGICTLLFLLLVFQRKREEDRKRREVEYLTAQRRLESSRDQLNTLRKRLYEVENLLSDNRHFFMSRREELVQIAKQLKDVEEERDKIRKTLAEGPVSESERNLLGNRLKLAEDKYSDISSHATELQESVTKLEQTTKDSENQLSTLQNQIAQAESELEYNKELVRIKEKMVHQ